MPKLPLELHDPHDLYGSPLRQACIVTKVLAPAHAPEWARWLAELGFIPGEQVSVLARGLSASAPLVVRAGSSTFALRQAEAACVQVRPLAAALAVATAA